MSKFSRLRRRGRWEIAYREALRRQATAQAKRLSESATRLGLPDRTLTIEVHGEVRAEEYMKAGWHPLTQAWEAQVWEGHRVQVPVFTLTIDRW